MYESLLKVTITFSSSAPQSGRLPACMSGRTYSSELTDGTSSRLL